MGSPAPKRQASGEAKPREHFQVKWGLCGCTTGSGPTCCPHLIDLVPAICPGYLFPQAGLLQLRKCLVTLRSSAWRLPSSVRAGGKPSISSLTHFPSSPPPKLVCPMPRQSPAHPFSCRPRAAGGLHPWAGFGARGKDPSVGRSRVKTQGRGGSGMPQPLRPLLPACSGAGTKWIWGMEPETPLLLTVPCEMRSGSSSRGPRGPLPFARGHFGTARRHRRGPASPPAVPAPAIPGLGPFLRSLCHLVGPAPSTRRGVRAAAGGAGIPARGAQGRSKGASEEEQRSVLVANRHHGRGGSCGPQGAPAPRGPELQPPGSSSSSSSHRPEIRLLAPVLCPECSDCPGCALCPRGKLCLASLLCLQSALCPGIFRVPGIPGVHGMLISTLLVTSKRTQEME